MKNDFIEAWNATHDWDFNAEGMYEKHARRFFELGYKMARARSGHIDAVEPTGDNPLTEEQINEFWNNVIMREEDGS